MKLNYFARCQSFNEVKAEYKKLALAHHPDLFQNPSEKIKNESIMKDINKEFEFVSNNPELVSKNNSDIENKHPADFEKFRDIINNIASKGLFNMPEINIELCGSWLWASGQTYLHADKFRELGFNFCKGKKMWSWKPFEAKSRFYRGKNSIDDIRSKYGSTKIRQQQRQLAVS